MKKMQTHKTLLAWWVSNDTKRIREFNIDIFGTLDFKFGSKNYIRLDCLSVTSWDLVGALS